MGSESAYAKLLAEERCERLLDAVREDGVRAMFGRACFGCVVRSLIRLFGTTGFRIECGILGWNGSYL